MNQYLRSIQRCLLSLAIGVSCVLFADNQTPTTPPPFADGEIPFRVSIELADFSLPNGFHSGVVGLHEGKWLLLAGRTNGLHGFIPDSPVNFPPSTQNTTVYVVDPAKGKVYSRSLTSRKSGLTQDQIDSLSVTASQYYQSGNTLYISGGYGYRNSIQNFTTFDALTAVNIPGLMKWVIHGDKHKPASRYIRQIFDPVFKVTGGGMDQLKRGEPTLLVFGQDFEGPYFSEDEFQKYTLQVRRFHILDDGITLRVRVLESLPLIPDPSFRRRDLNIVRALGKQKGKLALGLVALSGVFTETNGVWTVPVSIAADGSAFMAAPADPNTFKQGMNNYASATMGLYSKKTGDMYTVLLGGLTFWYFDGNSFQNDPEIPFTNQLTTVRIDKTGTFQQFFMEGQEYPVILSTQSHPGNQLLFGTNAVFIPSTSAPELVMDVLDLDKIKEGSIVGHIVGGIQSTLPNTETQSDSAASPYIFNVRILPNGSDSSS